MTGLPRATTAILALAAVLALLIAGCGGGDAPTIGRAPTTGQSGGDADAAAALGFPVFATKNTTRVGGGDAIADAAGVAEAVYANPAPANRPPAVALVAQSDWQAAIAAAVLMGPPLHAPTLLTDGDDLPDATSSAFAALAPTGAKATGGAGAIAIGGAPVPDDAHSVAVDGADGPALAAAIDRLQSRAAGAPSDHVVIATADDPAYAMPAAGWAAKSGDPVLFVHRQSIPQATLRALRRHDQPRIYVLGPAAAVSNRVLQQLQALGTVRRIAGRDPIETAIAFARYVDGSFGWGVTDPGHGLAFANPNRPADAAAAAPLSATGTFAPLLLVSGDGSLPPAVVQYLLDIQPGYDKDPVRGVYNHGWLIGDQHAISVATQARIDTLLEIVPVNPSAGKSTTP